jgi:hypothetical protein
MARIAVRDIDGSQDSFIKRRGTRFRAAFLLLHPRRHWQHFTRGHHTPAI